MKKRFNKIASILICITFAVFLLFIKDRIDYIWGALCTFASILKPFIYAFAIAYILNFPYRFLRKKVFGKINNDFFQQKINKPISLVLTYVIFLGLVSFLTAILIPQLSENISILVQNVPSYVKSFNKTTDDVLTWAHNSYNLDMSIFDGVNKTVTEFLSSLTNMNTITNIYTAAVSTASFFYNWVMAFIISVYMLGSKEFLCTQLKRAGAAFLPTKWMPTIYEIINVSDDKCGKFLVGKVLDSAIVGVLCFICLTIFGFPYAPLISVLVAICNIIPFFGPFIGAIPSASLLFLVDPALSFWFIIIIFLIQQLDGNFIGPKVVGSQVGLIGFWSLFSVIVGGGMFGVTGMILGTPIFAAIYTLVGRKTDSRVLMKGENAQRVIDMPVVKSGGLMNMKAKVIKNPRKKNSTKTDEMTTDDNTDIE